MNSFIVGLPIRKRKSNALEKYKQKNIRTEQSFEQDPDQEYLDKYVHTLNKERVKTQNTQILQSITNPLLNRSKKQYQRSKRFSFNFDNSKMDIMLQSEKQANIKLLPSIVNKEVNQTKYRIKNDNQQMVTKKNSKISQPKKMLDLMIDILKQENNYNKKQSIKTPMQPQQSNDYFSAVQSKKRYKGPKVIQNQILKHSNNLNVVRKKLCSQHKQKRQANETRGQLNSSSNQRFASKKSGQQIQLWNTNVQLLTFYPKATKKVVFQNCCTNEFLNDIYQ